MVERFSEVGAFICTHIIKSIYYFLLNSSMAHFKSATSSVLSEVLGEGYLFSHCPASVLGFSALITEGAWASICMMWVEQNKKRLPSQWLFWWFTVHFTPKIERSPLYNLRQQLCLLKLKEENYISKVPRWNLSTWLILTLNAATQGGPQLWATLGSLFQPSSSLNSPSVSRHS